MGGGDAQDQVVASLVPTKERSREIEERDGVVGAHDPHTDTLALEGLDAHARPGVLTYARIESDRGGGVRARDPGGGDRANGVLALSESLGGDLLLLEVFVDREEVLDLA